MWCGVVWCGVVWCGVVWCGVVWCGVVWCGVVWCGVVLHDVVLHDVVLCGMESHCAVMGWLGALSFCLCRSVLVCRVVVHRGAVTSYCIAAVCHIMSHCAAVLKTIVFTVLFTDDIHTSIDE